MKLKVLTTDATYGTDGLGGVGRGAWVLGDGEECYYAIIPFPASTWAYKVKVERRGTGYHVVSPWGAPVAGGHGMQPGSVWTELDRTTSTTSTATVGVLPHDLIVQALSDVAARGAIRAQDVAAWTEDQWNELAGNAMGVWVGSVRLGVLLALSERDDEICKARRLGGAA